MFFGYLPSLTGQASLTGLTEAGQGGCPWTPDGDQLHRSQIPLADRCRKLAFGRGFQPAADRIQNHRFSLTDHARGKAAANIGRAASFTLPKSSGFLNGSYRCEAATSLAAAPDGRPVRHARKQGSKFNRRCTPMHADGLQEIEWVVLGT